MTHIISAIITHKNTTPGITNVYRGTMGAWVGLAVEMRSQFIDKQCRCFYRIKWYPLLNLNFDSASMLLDNMVTFSVIWSMLNPRWMSVGVQMWLTICYMAT